MTCNLCGANEATVHLTEILNEQMIEIHLCDACAAEKGTAFNTHFNFSDLLSGFSEPGDVAKKKKKSPQCSECSMSYEEFGKVGRLGCPKCYQAFSEYLLPLIKRVQRATHHVGKKPTRVPRSVRSNHDLRMLQDQLRKCVQSEDFEEAASVRDKIKKIQVKMKKSDKNE